MNLNLDSVPATLDEAVFELLKNAAPHEMVMLQSNNDPVATGQFGFSRVLRGAWSLGEDTPLTRDIKRRFRIFGHADDLSAIVLHCAWRQSHCQDWEAEPLVETMREHWRNLGIDPITGERKIKV